MPDGRRESRSPAEWVDRLPPIDTLLGAAGDEHQPDVLRVAPVTARRLTGYRNARAGGRFLNRVEELGPAFEATLRLERDALSISPESGPAGDEGAMRLDLEALTAVQTSSRSLQVNSRSAPLHDFRFHDESLYLWENLLREALQVWYRARGRGRIAEFQPRIAVAP